MEKKLSIDIVIPVYNEQQALEKSITTLFNFLTENLKDFDWKIVIADNASLDNTFQIAKKLSEKNPQKISALRLEQKGRGRAVKKAWRESRADIVSYMDVDLSTSLDHLRGLFEGLEKGFDIAIGSRLKRGARVKGRTLKREIISRCYNMLIKLMFLTKFSDAQCGFKAVTRKVVQTLIPHIKDNEWFFDSEMLIVGEKAGYGVYEVPVLWIDDPGSTVKVMKTASGDIKGLIRLFLTKPWEKIKK